MLENTISVILLILPIIAESVCIGFLYCGGVELTEYCIRPTRVIMWEYGKRKSNATIYELSIMLVLNILLVAYILTNIK